ncbi:Fatty acid hydroxylase superfamily protein [Ruegeria sp. THAF57]|uniref:sterol desaturase family protein n=1 Tax=Ruegeria sp. THAF57 TaxID=2744555 RepID=UPI0015DEE036|nr:sterol desaturase family protein [Ruegeria sp. THAF57]CAD0184100.1 Fatty acid hydroxylase superfamily protein [Ruegeria sp. THAF57]
MTDQVTFPDAVQWAIPFFIAAILAEFIWIAVKGKGGRYETRDSVTSLIMGAGNIASDLMVGFLIWAGFMWLWQITPLNLGTSIPVIILCFVLDDLRYYWVHRFGHRIRWVWASHVNHHSSQHYNLTTALRQTWTYSFTFMMVVRSPLILLGFHPAMVLFCGGVNLVYQFWIHTEAIKKMPRWFEAVMNTPSHHRAHHGRNARYLDCNYAGTFIIWDKLFGTFVPEQEDDKVDYGLVHNIGTFNPLRVAFHEWVGIWRDATQPGLTVRQRLAYCFAPPGYSHDGSRDNSEQIKAKHIARHPEDRGSPGFEQFETDMPNSQAKRV